MNVASVGAGNSLQASQQTAEAREPAGTGADHDGDSDDRGMQAVQPAPSPTVNGVGERIGQFINVQA
jgi:hypothetical protein